MIYAIGDIHGKYDKFMELRDRLPILTKKDILVFLGDYIDRGPDSKKVIEAMIQTAKHYNCVHLKGNHERMLIDYQEGIFENFWLSNGGYATLNSYEASVPYTKKEIPKEHLNFIANTLLYYVTEDYLFVHAGIDPYKDNLDSQTADDLLWIRDTFLMYPHKLDKIIVYGHTPTENFKPRIHEDKIGLDTAACFGGRLTCMRFPDQKYWQA